MSKSTKRVEQAAHVLGLSIIIQKMPESTRTAQDAAFACGCTVGQIVKSMVFEGAETSSLKLLLVSGFHNVNLDRAESLFGEALLRADPKRVREETGFAIGGVAPFGHLNLLETWMDSELLQYSTVWAAAGAPNAVFETNPQALLQATNAREFINDKA